jgi:hypothetical protein
MEKEKNNLGIIDKSMIKVIHENVCFELVLAGVSFNPKFIKTMIEISFEQAEKLGLVKLI